MISEDKNIKCIDFLDKIASTINTEITKNFKCLTVSIGIGEKASSLSGFKCAVMEAKNAMEITRKLKGKNSIGNCRKLGIYKLFFSMENQEPMANLYNEILGKLNSYEKSDSKDMLNSLQVYIDENRNIGNAAEKLFIHRNTMKYRINKIEEILECDLKDDKTMFNIMLCLKIGHFLHLD